LPFGFGSETPFSFLIGFLELLPPIRSFNRRPPPTPAIAAPAAINGAFALAAAWATGPLELVADRPRLGDERLPDELVLAERLLDELRLDERLPDELRLVGRLLDEPRLAGRFLDELRLAGLLPVELRLDELLPVERLLDEPLLVERLLDEPLLDAFRLDCPLAPERLFVEVFLEVLLACAISNSLLFASVQRIRRQCASATDALILSYPRGGR
jgi:hypothetical protein